MAQSASCFGFCFVLFCKTNAKKSALPVQQNRITGILSPPLRENCSLQKQIAPIRRNLLFTVRTQFFRMHVMQRCRGAGRVTVFFVIRFALPETARQALFSRRLVPRTTRRKKPVCRLSPNGSFLARFPLPASGIPHAPTSSSGA